VIRERSSLTKTQLAGRAGISLGFLSRLEDGERQPSLATLQSLAIGLSVPIEAISYPAPDVFESVAASNRDAVIA
jgi:transcriptional regulator with XRE-family HTH domain